MDVRQFQDSDTKTVVSDGNSSTSTTESEYQNGELVTTTSSGDPESGSSSSSAPVTAEWATGQATADCGLLAPSLNYAQTFVPTGHPAASALSGAMGGDSEGTPENPIYTVTTHDDGSRSESWSDGQTWWYGEFDAAGNLTYEDEGECADTSAAGAATIAATAADAARGSSLYEPPEGPVSANELSDEPPGYWNNPGLVASRRLTAQLGIPTILAKPSLVAESTRETPVSPEQLAGISSIPTGTGDWLLFDDNGTFVGIYNPSSDNVYYRTQAGRFAVSLADLKLALGRWRFFDKDAAWWQNFYSTEGSNPSILDQRQNGWLSNLPSSVNNPGDLTDREGRTQRQNLAATSPAVVAMLNHVLWGLAEQYAGAKITGFAIRRVGAVFEVVLDLDDGRTVRWGGQKAQRFMAKYLKAVKDLPTQGHHIASDKGEWGAKFKKLFDGIKMNLDDPANMIDLPGHVGSHIDEYHELVEERLKKAIGTKTGKDAQAAVRIALAEIRKLLEANPRLPYKDGGLYAP